MRIEGGEGGAIPHADVIVDGPDNRVVTADDVALTGKVEARGSGNQIAFAAGSRLEKYAPAGFSATVPDIGVRSDTALIVEGEDNVIEVGKGVRLAMNIVVRGRNNRIRIGPHAYLHGFANLIADGATLTVGARTTMVQGSIQLHEAGAITIGSDCMISSQVYLSLSDIHPIYDRATGKRLNAARSIEIGDHVWLGLRTLVMKGTRIGTGAVTAAGSLVSGVVPAHSIAAGSPARIVRENIEWRRDIDPEAENGAPLDLASVVYPQKRSRWWPFGR